MKWIIDEGVIPGDPIAYMGLLKEKGIYCKSSGEFMRSPYSFADRKGIWVVFENQYSDALALLSDSDHVVRNPITEEEIEIIEKQAKIQFDKTAKRILNFIASLLTLSALVGLLYAAFAAIQGGRG